MDSTPSPSPRRRWLGLAGLMLAAAGLVPVVMGQVGPDLAGATPIAATTAPSTATTTLPAPTTTSAPIATTTTSAPVETTTTTAAPATTTTTAPAATRTAASTTTSQLAQVEAIADSSGFDWRTAGVVIHIGYNPTDCCHWGIYDYRDNSLWIGPTAFASPTRLRYVVLHELGHAWQWASGHLDQLEADMAPWGVSGQEALEYGADCIATVEGAQMDNYWACPAAAQAIVKQRLSGNWS